MTENFDEIKYQIKKNIAIMIDNGKVQEAKMLLDEYMNMVKDDGEAFSMQGIIAIKENRIDDARKLFQQGMSMSKDDFDLQYNLAYTYQIEEDYVTAAKLFFQLTKGQYSIEQKNIAKKSFDQFSSYYTIEQPIKKKKVVLFVKQGMDSFIGDIISGLSQDFELKKVIVTDLKQIEAEMQWADVCWFEWCDELIIHASRQPRATAKKIICRLHSYEAFTDYIQHVKWENVDRVLFVAEHIRDYVLKQAHELDAAKTVMVPNGINLNKFTYKERKPGYNIAYVGYINYKKGPMLLLHTFKAIYDADHRYKLYIAGQFQDGRYVLYFQQMIKAMGLENNVFFEGWQKNINTWLEDKNYIISTSVLEGNPLGIMEAMARGIKPLIHNFVGSEAQFGPYVWNTISDCVSMIKDKKYNSREYRKCIEKYYSLDYQIILLDGILQEMLDGSKDKIGEYYKVGFEKNSDDLVNTNKLFDFILDKEEEENYIKYVQEWFVKSNLPLEIQIKYYYGNLYRRLKRYTRFRYMSEQPYEKLNNIANSFMDKLYPIYFEKKRVLNNRKDKKIKVLFLLNGLDYNQIVTQFYIDLIKESENSIFEYHILSVLDKSEFRNADFSLDVIKQANINYYIPQSSKYDERMKEFYSYIAKLQPDIAMFQSFYFAPLIVLLYPILKKICKITGRFVHQQAEPHFDRELDFLSHYIIEDKSVVGKELFDFPWPIKTHIINKNFDIRAKFEIDKQQKIVVSLARDMYFRNNKPFWDFIIKMVTEIPNVTYAVFGPTYDEDYKQYIPEGLINEKKIVFCGFDLEAAAYMKSCDFFLNTFPLGGGSSLQEAYYAGLPMITFILSHGDKVDLEGNSYLIPLVWYQNAEDIFPEHGDFTGLFDFTKRLITDEQFEKYLKSKRKFAVEDMTYAAFSKKLEEYLMNKIRSES